MNKILNTSLIYNMLECILSNAKICTHRSYFCGHCLHRHLVLRSNEKELSTYALALKLILKKKQISKISDNDKINTVKVITKNLPKKKTVLKYTNVFKVSNHKSKETKVSVQKIKASDIPAFAKKPGMIFQTVVSKNKCIYESTRSYDPNVLFPHDRLQNFSQNSTEQNVEANFNKVTKSTKKVGENYAALPCDILKTNTQYYKNFKIKLESSNKMSKSKLKVVENEENIIKKNTKLDVTKILPLSAVKVVKMPTHTQSKLLKKSAKSSTQLVDSNNKKNQMNFLGIYSAAISSVTKSLINVEEQQSEIKEETEDLKHQSSPDEFQQIQVTEKSKEQDLIQLVQSYLDVAVSNNMLDAGLKMLRSYRKKAGWRTARKKEEIVDVYNILLHGYSSVGDWNTVTKIRHWMEEDRLKFNIHTYAAIIDCLGRAKKTLFLNEEAWSKEVLKIVKSICEDKISLNEIFTTTKLTKDKYITILETIKKILPFFEINSTETNLYSDCSLVKDVFKSQDLQSPLAKDFVKETMEKLVEEQLLVERNFCVRVKSVVGNSFGEQSEDSRKKFNELKKKWREIVHHGFLQNLKIAKMEHEKFPEKFNLYVYLKCIPASEFVELMMSKIENLLEYSGGYSPNINFLHLELGNKVYQRYKLKKKMDLGIIDRTEKLLKKYCCWYLDPNQESTNSRQVWQTLTQEDGCPLDIMEVKWSNELKISLGKFLYQIILKDVKITLGGSTRKGQDQFFPAFYLILRHKKLKAYEEIKCHPTLAKLFRKAGFETLTFDADEVPMVCPPKPWKDAFHGGYLILPTEFIRRPRDVCGKQLDLKMVPSRQLYPTFDSLNALQSVPWRVNENVLDIALEVFRNGGSDQLNVPKFPSAIDSKNISPEMSAKERWDEYKTKRNLIMERQNQYGLWCEALYRLSFADHFRKRVFWFPQNLDFRGRVYPVPPHLNHLGADLFRSLLLFAKGKPLGPKGLDWIKIHTINLTGTHKKKSVKERLEYANSILPEILDSAEKPLRGKGWWTKSDEPWQTLAACIEIKKVLSSPNPELYISTFPIHQDGSCNGLQHYAALGRDKAGAKSVNLSPSEFPQDVYSAVTQILETKRMKDAAEGVEIAQILEGFVKRKVVKQTIMTTVYGVTLYGARLQISKQLEDINNFPKEHVWKAAGYLTNKTFESLQQMFTSAREIQDWFIKCAETICKKKDYVQWISPLGLPVLQPYGKILSRSQRAKENRYILPNMMKQKNAFPPNFIHSLDSCHMMLTTLFCEQAGLTFASIHDCFWTHPSTVEAMNRICREQFVSLHSQPILENLSDFFVDCYLKGKGEENVEALNTFTSVPATSDFDLNSVLNSVYFFS